MVKYYETTGGYFYKIIKNNKKRISKKEYMKKNLKGGIGSNNNMGSNNANNSNNNMGSNNANNSNNNNNYNNCFNEDFKDNNWIVLLHGTMTDEEYKLPDNIQLYNYASLGDPYRIYLPPDPRAAGQPDMNKICNTAENTGSFIESIIGKVEHISKAEGGEMIFDMVLGGPSNKIPDDVYGIFRCIDGKPERVEGIDLEDGWITLHELLEIISEYDGENLQTCNTVHILSCRGGLNPQYETKHGTINSSKKPWLGNFSYIPSHLLPNHDENGNEFHGIKFAK